MMQEIEYLTLQDMVVVVVMAEGIMTEIEIIIIDHIWMKKTIIDRIVEILKTDLVDTVVMIEDINFFLFFVVYKYSIVTCLQILLNNFSQLY